MSLRFFDRRGRNSAWSDSSCRRIFGGRGRWRRQLGIATSTLLLVFVAATGRILVWPAQGAPSHVDAIVMLQGDGARLSVAERLAKQGRAPVLVVSRGRLGYGGPCPSQQLRTTQVICFDPNPADTRGEAEYAAKLAQRFHWKSVILVTTREQATRARLLMRRCFSGSVYVVTAAEPWYSWPDQIAYGWGSLFKALFLRRSC